MTVDPEGLPDELSAYAAQHCGKKRIWTSLRGGRSNRSWRLQSDTCDWVFKLFDMTRSNAVFPNDPQAEMRALTALTGTGLAPEYVASIGTRTGVCLVYHYLAGNPIDHADAEAMDMLGKLHSLPPVSGLRHVETTPAKLLREGRNILSGLETEPASRLLRHMPEQTDIRPGPARFVHGDPVPANILSRGTQRFLIDWQCPGVGDASADLAIALSPAMHVVYGAALLTPEAEDDALSAYPDKATIARYKALRPYYLWRMAAYCAWKAAQGEAIYAQAFEVEFDVLRRRFSPISP